MKDPFLSLFSAVSAAQTLANCTATLYIDSGTDVDGIWKPGLSVIDENIGGTIQKAKASEIKRFERGGERLEGGSRLYLASAPSQRPDIVEVNGETFKVYDVNFSPSRSYWRILMARQL